MKLVLSSQRERASKLYFHPHARELFLPIFSEYTKPSKVQAKGRARENKKNSTDGILEEEKYFGKKEMPIFTITSFFFCIIFHIIRTNLSYFFYVFLTEVSTYWFISFFLLCLFLEHS